MVFQQIVEEVTIGVAIFQNTAFGHMTEVLT